MQLLDSQLNKLSDIPDSLQISLQDIVNRVQIESHHYIKHPDYKNEELPESVISRFQQLPLEIQNQHLILLLRNLLYSVYYNGSFKSNLASDAEKTNLAPNQNLENNRLFGVDLAFYERLHSSNKSTGYWSHDWVVVKEETDGTLAVHRNGLTLHIERDIHLPPEHQTATVGNLVAIKMPKNLVQNAFYMAMSNVSASPIHQNLVRIYFNVTPDGAVSVMESLTTQLNAIPISFSFKALNNPSDYERYDSAVLYFDKNNYEVVYPILERVYTENQSYFSEQIPLFTKLLAPGLACAEEPNHKFGDQESFGTNRCQIVANGLVDAWLQGNNTPTGRVASILQNFSLHSIKLAYPYLNPNSEDIYTPLNL
ncbi:T3SS effector HopA1 family protein [Cylindrospermum sp. FACHB-282]|uniref:T3SS effector HopA1 family protein n=1 Tax=Cylindrospermum sp. FACHB-282 TaxID=2692794 RepID=UPI0016888BA4|nr:T3SS effector HopA1 family protein [Cylindrospermum sp. FACHB-282]MBD2385182.1 hypothetical protein [Cylindrospermum sp. FACHB-282]